MINVKSLKFDAAKDLLDYSLSPEPENKCVRLQTRFPGEDLVIERHAHTFEEAVTEAADAMKEKIVRVKEKRFEK